MHKNGICDKKVILFIERIGVINRTEVVRSDASLFWEGNVIINSERINFSLFQREMLIVMLSRQYLLLRIHKHTHTLTNLP